MNQTEKLKEIEEFLKSKGFKKKSIKSYISILNRVINHLDIEFKEEELEKLFTKLNLKPRTYNLYRSVCNFYTKKELGYELSFTKAKVDKSLPNYINKEEFTRFLSYVYNFKHKIWYMLMYHSGLRVSEVTALRKHDIDIEHQIIWIRKGKGGKDRRTIIPTIYLNELELYLKTIDDYLFPTYNGIITTRSIEERLNKARIESKLTKQFSCHDLRHSFAINLVNKGVNLEDIRKMLGHVKLTTTQIYLQCIDSNLTEIAKCV